MKLESKQRIEKSKWLMDIYFKVADIKIKHRVKGRIKGKTVEEKKKYVKENIATLCILLDQLSVGGLGYKGQNFDGVLTFVLNKYKNIDFKYSDWSRFNRDSTFNEGLARDMLNKLYDEFEYTLKGKKE